MQFIYCGKKSTLSIGNVKPIGEMPEGTVICNVEEVSSFNNFPRSLAPQQASQFLCHGAFACCVSEAFCNVRHMLFRRADLTCRELKPKVSLEYGASHLCNSILLAILLVRLNSELWSLAAESRRQGRPCSCFWRLCHCRVPQQRQWHQPDQAPFRFQEGLHLP